MWADFKMFFALEYNELREEQCLNATQAGLQKYSPEEEEEQKISSVLDSMAPADFSDNDVIAQIISSNKRLKE